jgi:hypothetical protein
MWSDWIRNIIDIELNLATGLAGLGAALGLFVLSQAALVALLVAIPADFFCRSAPSRTQSRPVAAMRWATRIVKNVAGAIMILLGIPLALPGIPGPGLVLIFVGIALLDFPGKRRLLDRLISRPRVFGSINSLRTRFGRPPLIACQPEEALAFTPVT